MNTLDKMIGAGGCFYVLGASEASIPAGYTAYAAMIGVDATEIATVDELIDGVATELADASWEGVALLRGDLITFENPITSITLTNETDSVICYLEPTSYVAPE